MTRSPLETLRDIELRRAEDQLCIARGRIEGARVVIHDERYDLTARIAFAQAMGLPAPSPRTTQTRMESTDAR